MLKGDEGMPQPLHDDRVKKIEVQDFAGADTISVVNSRVMKRALLAILGLVGVLFCSAPTVRAEFDPIFGFYRPELFTTLDSSALVRDLPLTAFLDGRLPGSTALGRMGTAPIANFPIALMSAEPPQKRNAVSEPVMDPKDGKEYSSAESLAAKKASLVWTGGEVGFFYGHSASGHWSGDEFGSYITGGVGNEHLQINVGASYQEFNSRLPRWRQ
jgi:hypothetical protein